MQVLLSQVHRLRALALLSKFLDLGQYAVNWALSVGIFGYLLKLLLLPAAELRAALVFIWAKLLAVDISCQADLLKDKRYTFFVSILSSAEDIPAGPFNILVNPSEHKALCAFVISVFCKDNTDGQQVILG